MKKLLNIIPIVVGAILALASQVVYGMDMREDVSQEEQSQKEKFFWTDIDKLESTVIRSFRYPHNPSWSVGLNCEPESIETAFHNQIIKACSEGVDLSEEEKEEIFDKARVYTLVSGIHVMANECQVGFRLFSIKSAQEELEYCRTLFPDNAARFQKILNEIGVTQSKLNALKALPSSHSE